MRNYPLFLCISFLLFQQFFSFATIEIGKDKVSKHNLTDQIHAYPDTTTNKVLNYSLLTQNNNTSNKNDLGISNSFEPSDILDYFATSTFLEPRNSILRFQIGLGNNLNLDNELFKYTMPPVSIQFERAINYNITATLGIGGQLISFKDSPIKYQYYNVFLGANYHFNLELLTGISALLPYVGLSTSYRLAFLNAYEGEFKATKGKASLELVTGVKYNFEKLGFLFELGATDTACARFGIFILLNNNN